MVSGSGSRWRTSFNSQPLEGGCGRAADFHKRGLWFQLTAARRRLPARRGKQDSARAVSTHSRSKAAALVREDKAQRLRVSTHSRSKAAARARCKGLCARGCFNSQPLEGGCLCSLRRSLRRLRFNSQPLEGGCCRQQRWLQRRGVSTHSRSKAAAQTVTHDT